MSIALVVETQNEVKRLLVAGSELGADDFRLKKLLPLLKKAGESVPVFARLADTMEKVVNPGEGKVSDHLLELANLVNAILYTQGQSGREGTLEDMNSLQLSPDTRLSFRWLKPVLDALTSKGSGRTEVIRNALEEGMFEDLRLIQPLINALDDHYAELVELVFHALLNYGPAISPVLKNSIDFSGGKGHGRRLELLARFLGKEGRDFYLEVVEKGSVDVKTVAIRALKDLPDCLELLLELSRERRKEIREASLYALAHLDLEPAVQRLFEVYNSKEQSLALEPVKISKSPGITRMFLEEAEKALEILLRSEQQGFSLFAKKVEPPAAEEIEKFAALLYTLEGKKGEAVFAFLKKCFSHSKHLQQFQVNRKIENNTDNTLARMTACNLLAMEMPEAYDLLDTALRQYDSFLLGYCFEAAVRSREPDYVFDRYARYLKGGRKSFEGEEILRVLDGYVDFDNRYRLAETAGERMYNQRPARAGKDEIRWDRRWPKPLADIDELRLVCRLTSAGDKASVQYLLKKVEGQKDFNAPLNKDILQGLLQAEYPLIMEVVQLVLDYNFKRAINYLGYYVKDFTRVLRLLPKKYAKDIESFAAGYNNEAAAKLFEVAQELRGKKEE
jgi:hypothetical protein